MSQGSFILLLLIMWAVVATLYTVIFKVTPGPEKKASESAPVHPGERRIEHRLPHAA
ncbi:MAG TPA: hypothetical protein VMH80_18690 [Bryobacteraceae bacterium]|nr:hypothetical protein [Bryobacteraceae bacterium]